MKAHALSDEEIGRRSTVELNGRQIKNVLKIAQLLVRRHKVPLALKHLKVV